MSEQFYSSDEERFAAIEKSRRDFGSIESADSAELEQPAPPAVDIRHSPAEWDALQYSKRFVNSINEPLSELEQIQAGILRPDILAEREQARATEAEQMPLNEAVNLLLLRRKSPPWQAISNLIAEEYRTLTATAEDVNNSNPNFGQRATAVKNVWNKIGALFQQAEQRIQNCTPEELRTSVPSELQGIAQRNAKSAEPPTEK